MLHDAVIDQCTATGSSTGSSRSTALKLSPSATAVFGPAKSAGVADAVFACGTTDAPRSFLHSQGVFAAHAANTIRTFESVVRFAARDCAWWLGAEDETSMMSVVHRLTAVAVLLARQAGPGSAEMQQCHSLLASVLKLAECPAAMASPF